MKRIDLIRYLTQHCCKLVREGGEHSVWENQLNKRRTSQYLVIEKYLTSRFQGYASIWKFLNDPINHVVCGWTSAQYLRIITVYLPKFLKWSDDRTRRQ